MSFNFDKADYTRIPYGLSSPTLHFVTIYSSDAAELAYEPSDDSYKYLWFSYSYQSSFASLECS